MRPDRVLLVVLAGLVVGCLVASPARAADVLAGYDDEYPDRIAVFGAGAVWTMPAFDGGFDVLRAKTGGPARRVRRVRGGRSFIGDTVSPGPISVSAGRAAISLRAVLFPRGEPSFIRRSSAALVTLGSGSIDTFRICGEGPPAESAISWPWLVVAGCGGGRQGPVDAFNLSDRSDPLVRLAAMGSSVRVAGRVAAWQEPGALVARDLFTRAEVSRIPETALPGPIGAWDVQADGKIAVALSEPGRADTRIAWFDRGGSAGPTIVTPGGGVAGLRFAKDRLAFERYDEPAGRTALVVRSLAGEEDVAARYLSTGVFDFDGTRAAWVRKRCDGTQVAVGAVGAQRTSTQRVDVCPLTLVPEDSGEIVSVVLRNGRFFASAHCHELLPPRSTDRCRIAARLTSRGRSYAARRLSVVAGRSFELKLDGGRRMWRRKPYKVMLRIATTMRGRTVRTRTALNPSYEGGLPLERR